MSEKVTNNKTGKQIKKKLGRKILHIFLSYAFVSGLVKIAAITVKNLKKYKTDAAMKDLPKYAAVFKNKNIVVDGKEFKGGIIGCICSGMTLDLSKAVLNGDVALKCNMLMSGVNIIVPENVKVEVEQKSFLSSLSNEVPDEEEITANTVYIKTDSALSGLYIKTANDI